MFNHKQHWSEIKTKADKGELTLEKFSELVSKADWFYYMADQNLSPLEMDTLFTIANTGSDDFKRTWNREHAKRFNNESFYPKDDPARHYTYPFPDLQPLTIN